MVRLEVLVLALAAMVSAFDSRAMTLGDALRLASERDPFLDSAAAAYAAEAQLGSQERAGLRPTLSFDAQGLQNRTDAQFAFGRSKDSYPSWSAGLQARQPLFRMDWSARNDRADLRDALARESFDDRRSQFLVRVSQRYLDALLAEDLVRQSESEARSVHQSMSDVQKRFDVELVPGTDLKEAQARDDLSKAELLANRAALDDARDALYEVTGYDRSPLPALREDLVFPLLSPVEVQDWVKLADENSRSRRIAQMQVDVAKSFLESRKAEALPVADLVARAGRSDSTEYALGQRQDEAVIGVELSIPIYGGGYNRSRILEAQARLQEAQNDARRVALETERSVRKYFRAVETARAEVTAYQRVLESATLAEQATRVGYDAGTRTIIDVLDARSRVVSATRNRNSSRLTLLIQLLQLFATSGILTTEAVFGLDPFLFGGP